MSPLNATKALFIMGFIVLASSRRDTASQYGKGCNISATCLRYSANHNALDSYQSEHTSLLRMMSFVKIDAFQKGGTMHRRTPIMYSMWKIICFLNLKLHKHIALNQIHKIMFWFESEFLMSCNRSSHGSIVTQIFCLSLSLYGESHTF